MDVDIIERKEKYNEDHAWQHEISQRREEKDLELCGLTEEYVNNLSVNDFDYMEVKDKRAKEKVRHFIKQHEWLGRLSQYTTHWFVAYHESEEPKNVDPKYLIGDNQPGIDGQKSLGFNDNQKILAGVELLNMPNAFSKILGEDTDKLERLISRGATISWTPKNLASSFLMWVIRYMVKNTRYRLFTAYADPTANELGTIYQACNFDYLGDDYGTTTRYINPYTDKIVSSRFFRTRSAYKKYAKELGVNWGKDWNDDQTVHWENIPDSVEEKLRQKSKEKVKEAEKVEFPSKHKYAYVLGENKRETKKLQSKFEKLNETYEYPKERGT